MQEIYIKLALRYIQYFFFGLQNTERKTTSLIFASVIYDRRPVMIRHI